MSDTPLPNRKPGRPSLQDRILPLLLKRPPLTNKQIAERLGCRANTVSSYRAALERARPQA